MTLETVGDNSPFAQSGLNDVRFIGAVQGRYVLSGRRAGADGKPAVYACRLCSISTSVAVLIGPVVGAPGEKITAHFEPFGILHGTVGHKVTDGFAMDLVLSEAERNALIGKIVWQRRRAAKQAPDKRTHKRFAPRDPRTILTLRDGRRIPGFVIDVSASGVAVSAELTPDLGTPMIVGKIVGYVVRRLEVGFALKFAEPREYEQLETLLAAPEQQ